MAEIKTLFGSSEDGALRRAPPMVKERNKSAAFWHHTMLPNASKYAKLTKPFIPILRLALQAADSLKWKCLSLAPQFSHFINKMAEYKSLKRLSTTISNLVFTDENKWNSIPYQLETQS